MSRVGRRCLFGTEVILSVIILGLAIWLLVKGPLVDLYSYEAYTDIRYTAPRFLVSISGWSCFFSIVWFFSSFSRSRKEAESKNHPTLTLLIVTLEWLIWLPAAACFSYTAWYVHDDVESSTWILFIVAAACSCVMVVLEFTNFVLACLDVKAVRIAKRNLMAVGAKHDPEGYSF